MIFKDLCGFMLSRISETCNRASGRLLSLQESFRMLPQSYCAAYAQFRSQFQLFCHALRPVEESKANGIFFHYGAVMAPQSVIIKPVPIPIPGEDRPRKGAFRSDGYLLLTKAGVQPNFPTQPGPPMFCWGLPEGPGGEKNSRLKRCCIKI